MVSEMLKTAWATAWNMLIDFPSPFTPGDKTGLKDKTATLLCQLFFPVVGLVCALLALLVSRILAFFLYPVPAAAVFAALLTYFCIFKDNGRGLAGLLALLSSRQRGVSMRQSLDSLPDTIGEVDTPAANVIMVLAVLFNIFAFYLMLFYNYVYFLAAILMLEFALEGDLAAIPSADGNQPLLAVGRKQRFYIWILTGFMVLFVLFKAPAASLLLFGAGFGLSLAVRAYCRLKGGVIDGKLIGLAACVFEIFALILGVIFLARGHILLR
ncbi:MAG: hypothetical protein PHV59_12700 [Victivallales bacterium]|nr:hypothetical protein [Victivallales bacterium]